jgi:WD40 repeat protein
MAVYGTHGKSMIIEFLKVDDKSIKVQNSFNSGISSALLHADWSRDSGAISINTQAAELLYYTINTTGKCSSASSLRDEPWSTWTQKFGFPVQGIYQNPDYTDINTVCRDPTGKFLAVGYDDQCIRLFKYPTYIPKQVHKTLYGHSSHVTRIRFTPHYMVSLGGLDRTIIVWDLDRGDEEVKENQD